MAFALLASPFVAATSAHAAPAAPAPAAPAAPAAPILPDADAPMPVSDGEYSFIATHDVTRRAATMKAPEAIASLPVPQQYRPANLALAAQFDQALAGALAAPGGCLQVIVDPRARSGNLFNYGFFPVAAPYCP
ncbi:hypothetical protein AAFP35_08850 [Gordonia sp. CPCC 206044]